MHPASFLTVGLEAVALKTSYITAAKSSDGGREEWKCAVWGELAFPKLGHIGENPKI